MNGEADNSRFVKMHVYMHLAFKELNGIASPLSQRPSPKALSMCGCVCMYVSVHVCVCVYMYYSN